MMEEQICENCRLSLGEDRYGVKKTRKAKQVEMVFYHAVGNQMEDSGRCLVNPITRIVGVRETRQLGPITMHSDTCERWTAIATD